MLISEEYKQQQRQLHIDRDDYGVASVGFADKVTMILDQLKITEMLDYGCGKGRLAENIHPNHALNIIQYDPGIDGIDEIPDPAQFVTCIDVLEHIEPEYLDNVLDDLKRVTISYGFFTVHCGPAVKTLPDGRNAHLIQEPPKWWLPKIMERFELITFSRMENGFTVLVKACPLVPIQT